MNEERMPATRPWMTNLTQNGMLWLAHQYVDRIAPFSYNLRRAGIFQVGIADFRLHLVESQNANAVIISIKLKPQIVAFRYSMLHQALQSFGWNVEIDTRRCLVSLIT